MSIARSRPSLDHDEEHAHALEVIAFIPQIVAYLDSQFPRTCALCGIVYETFADCARLTTSAGRPMAFDDHIDDPVGILGYANCRCGTTMSLRCEAPPGEVRRAFRRALANDVKATKLSEGVILARLADEVRGCAIAAAAAPNEGPRSSAPDTERP